LDRVGLKSEAWLVALEARTGRELWRFVQPSYTGGVMVEGAPGLIKNLVIFSTVGGRVVAVDRSTHAVVWTFASPQARYATVSQAEVYDGTVYADGGDERLYALDAATGAVRWASPTLSATQDLLVTNKRIYHSNGGKLRIVDRATGGIVATVAVRSIEDAIESPASFADGSVFVTVSRAAWSFAEP
jgi:outer membrane protein assembly factor BamB